jgi:hypothetical protein
MSVAETPEEQLIENASTRPTAVTRHASRVQRKVIRFTLDLEKEQHTYLKLFAFQNGVQSALVMRTLLYLLEMDKDLATRVIEEIYGEEAQADDE